MLVQRTMHVSCHAYKTSYEHKCISGLTGRSDAVNPIMGKPSGKYLNHSQTPRVKSWVIQSFLTFDSMYRTLKCDHSLERC